MTVWQIALGVAALLLGAWAIRRFRYAGRMFAEENFAQFHVLFTKALEAARTTADQESGPSVDDGSAFVTDAGLAVGVSFHEEEEGLYGITVSMSQPGQVTTRSVCSRFGFFVLAMLWQHDKEVAPLYMPSLVHYVHVLTPSAEPDLLDFETSYAIYAAEYQPIPFQPAT